MPKMDLCALAERFPRSRSWEQETRSGPVPARSMTTEAVPFDSGDSAFQQNFIDGEPMKIGDE